MDKGDENSLVWEKELRKKKEEIDWLEHRNGVAKPVIDHYEGIQIGDKELVERFG